MKKYQFWIITGVLFLVLIVLYILLVSNERENAKREEKQKKDAISDLENLRNSAINNKVPSNFAVENVTNSANAINNKIQEIESYIKDSQKEFLYVKGDKDWKFNDASALQYTAWYNKKRNEIFDQLKQSNFVFEVEGRTSLDSNEEDKLKESIGFTIWGSETPKEKEILESQQKLALINVISDVLCNIFKDKKNMFPVFQKVIAESWMEKDVVNGLQKSKAVIKLDVPFAIVNVIINELEKSKLRFKVDNVDISKKANARDYLEHPNVSLSLNVSFQVIYERKAE